MSAAGALRRPPDRGWPGADACQDAVTDAGVLESHRFRRVLGHVPTGVALITATTPEGPTGMAVNSFASVSLDPPLVSFCAALTSSTWPRIEAAGAFAVNVLGAHDAELCRLFARKGCDRFAGLAHRPGATGAPVLDGVAAHLDCRIHAVHEAGDHVIVLGRVVHLEADEGVPPLVFHGGGYGTLRPSPTPPQRAGTL